MVAVRLVISSGFIPGCILVKRKVKINGASGGKLVNVVSRTILYHVNCIVLSWHMLIVVRRAGRERGRERERGKQWKTKKNTTAYVKTYYNITGGPARMNHWELGNVKNNYHHLLSRGLTWDRTTHCKDTARHGNWSTSRCCHAQVVTRK